jgi:hypothetical protein
MKEELRVVAPAVHYLCGVALGAIYGAYADRWPAAGSGTAFGTTVWLVADEIARPSSVYPSRRLGALSECICSRSSRTLHTARQRN